MVLTGVVLTTTLVAALWHGPVVALLYVDHDALVAIDAQGQPLWRHNFGSLRSNAYTDGERRCWLGDLGGLRLVLFVPTPDVLVQVAPFVLPRRARPGTLALHARQDRPSGQAVVRVAVSRAPVRPHRGQDHRVLTVFASKICRLHFCIPAADFPPTSAHELNCGAVLTA